ncbi:hypothetical protein Z962_p0080 (plasmid) [Clostridium botulinum C/D str. BKT12695]|nr:hypothetical protein Z962_p0080 [Clostridium botulinum C/D str. BKT12695]
MGCSNDEISNSNTNINSNSKTLSSYSDEQYEEYKNQELEYESKEKEYERESKEYEYDKENYSQTIYVGSQNSDKYHIPECEWANKIHINNLIEFSSKEEAKKKQKIWDINLVEYAIHKTNKLNSI